GRGGRAGGGGGLVGQAEPPYGTPSSSSFDLPPSRAVRIHAPVSVSVNVCSEWAAHDPSAVTTVQSSSRVVGSWLPRITIGSTARARPFTSRGPLPGRP